MAMDWYEVTRKYTLRLVGVRSVSPSEGENQVAHEVVRLLQEDGLDGAYTAIGLDAIEGDPFERQNAYAFLRGQSPRTVVLLGHIDTVGTADYGPMERWALDPEELAARHATLAAMIPEIATDEEEHPNDWLFGRGVMDMKSGVATNIAVMRRLAEQARAGALPLSVVLLATPDEENESAGVLQGVRFLLRLREQHGLDYAGAINTDYTTGRYPGDPHRYVYTGTIGKLLPSFLVVGRESHVGDPFDGVDANLLAAELIRDLSMNPDLCDVVRGQSTPPPVTLHATDLKDSYNVQLPFAAYFYLNVLTFESGPEALLARLRERAEAAMHQALERIDRAERQWLLTQGDAARMAHLQARSGAVLTYAELYEEAVHQVGEPRVTAELDAEWERWPATLDKRERSLRLVHRLWTLTGRRGPAVVIYYSPPYYPHIAANPSPLHEAVSAVAMAHADQQLAVQEYYPYLSDMSYLRLEAGENLTALTSNMPVWRDADGTIKPGAYSLPLDEIRRLDLPVVNFGPYGRGAHQRGERALMSYSFGVLPQLLYETIERLASV